MSKNIIFMGTPDFAVPTLKALHEKFTVSAVVTVPDKQKGRGRKVSSSPVKQAAEELGIDILQPESLKDQGFYDTLKAYNPDIICVVAFRILPPSIFELPNIASFNIHGSLLPKYRGAAPINWAIVNGETETGVTSFVLQKIVDTGNIIDHKKIPLDISMTTGDLHDALMPLSAELAVETTQKLIEGDYNLTPQDDSQASPAPKIFRDDCEINFKQMSLDVLRFLHGMSPIPGAWTVMEDKSLKILRAEQTDLKIGEAGSFAIDKNNFYVQCSDYCLNVLELQVQGKRAMKIGDFLPGYRGPEKGLLGN